MADRSQQQHPQPTPLPQPAIEALAPAMSLADVAAHQMASHIRTQLAAAGRLDLIGAQS